MEPDINRLLSRLTIAYRIANEKAMCDIGLHSGQVQILASLWEKDGQSQAELVKELCVSPPTVNKMVARLSESKFVSTKKCPSDRRLMRVYLTKKAVEVRTSVDKAWKELETRILEDFGKTEKVLLPILLQKIADNLTKELNLNKK